MHSLRSSPPVTYLQVDRRAITVSRSQWAEISESRSAGRPAQEHRLLAICSNLDAFEQADGLIAGRLAHIEAVRIGFEPQGGASGQRRLARQADL